MHRVFQAFIDGLAESSNAERLRAVLAEAGAALDLNCFAYLSMPPRRGDAPELISNYPLAWTDHYLRAHYERVDPVIVEVLTPQSRSSGDKNSRRSVCQSHNARCSTRRRSSGFAVVSRCPSTTPVARWRRSRSPRTNAAQRSSAASSKIGLCCSSWQCTFMLTHAGGCRSIVSSMVSRCRLENSNALNGPRGVNPHGRSGAF